MWTKILLQLIVLVLTASMALGQTGQWRLVWDPNPESDMQLYEVYRDTIPNPTTRVATLDHPDTVYVDANIKRGVPYYYRLKAVNTSGLASDFSEQVSAAIPKILDLPLNPVISPGSSLTYNLDNYVFDPDHADNTLNWQVSGNSELQVDINQNTRVLTITAPPGWREVEILNVTVTDPDEFFDKVIMRVESEGYSTSPPVIENLDDVDFDEDASLEIDLNAHVSDEDTPKSNLYWYAGEATNLTIVIDHNTNFLTVSAEENWNGTGQFWLYVKDPEQNTDSVLVTVIVNAVNDAPVFSALPTINLSLSTAYNLDLKNYVKDVDNTDAEMEWSYAGNQNVTVEITSQGLATFSVNQDWQGNEEFDLYVEDTQQGRDTTRVTVYRQNQAEAPQINNLPSIDMFEDGSEQIRLNDYVSDPNNSVDVLSWFVYQNAYIETELNSTNAVLTLRPQANWYGQTSIALKVTDPDGNVDYDTLEINVQSVNDAPTLKQIEDILLYLAVFHTIDLKEYIIEPDGLDDLVLIELLGQNNGYIGHYLDEQSYQLTFFVPMGYEGVETFMLRIRDKGGQEANSVFTVEVVSKAISGEIDVAYFGSQTNMRLQWETINPTKDYIEYGLTASYGKQTGKDAEYFSLHEQVLANLEPNQTYHFRVVSENQNGRIVFSADSIFTTGEKSEEVNVFPIPYRANDPQHQDGIFFTNLKGGSRITIYNLLGEVVFKTDKLNELMFRWDVKNNAAKDIHSGLYLYVILDHKKKRYATGKILIVR